MRQLLTTAAALALTVGAANAQDAAPPPADPAPVAGDANGQQQVSDAEFVAGMSTSLVWVREAGDLALLRAQSGDVGVFADRLRSEHAERFRASTFLSLPVIDGPAKGVLQQTK